ncbi:TonB-dependent siderophore receptor [Malaciobacter molluscorum]|uniref:TonB-dependent receptor n=1 Tax=Malaciobacter molluscorum TaxID=1032072 RepID=UPI00100AA611|nr:TonB-dependent receptor [Malaciobacter molluscorum]RXJ94382.1 TonB-dependent siderophore receptor [Malaciobacter molluscorum]
MKKFYIKRLLLISLVVNSILQGAQKTTNLGDVIVSANKIEENIKDIPQSITVIDKEIIDEKGIKNVADVINEIPNMYISPSHGGALNFRGLNTSMFTNNNPVVIYIDGIPTTDRNSFDVSLQNIERIEILRGPQGTLYGKDAIGGVINVITKEPNNITSGSINLEYGSNNYKLTTFDISTPIIENKLFFNLNGSISSDDGWVKNNYNKDDNASKQKEKRFNTTFLYKVNDKLSTKLVLKKEKTKNYWGNDLGIANATSLNQFKREDAKNTSFDMPSIEKNDIDSQSLNIKYEEDKYILNFLTTHKKNRFDSIFDADFTSGNAYDGSYMQRDMTNDTYTGEVRLTNGKNSNFKWIGGLYFDTEERKYNPYLMDYYFNNSLFMSGNAVSSADSSTKAIFAQTMIPINDKVELTLGGRYQKIKKTIDMTVFNYAMGIGKSSFDFDSEKTWNTFLPKVALSYKINDNFSSYISFSKGYMPGGFNNYASSSNEKQNLFDPQKSTNYELGIKAQLKDFIFSASIFRMDIKDIHVYRQVLGNYYTDNAQKAYSQGVAFDFTYFINDNIELSGAVGLIDTKYESFDAGDYDFSNNKIENTPSHTANISISYHHPKGFYARADLKNQGSLYFYDDRQKKFLKNDGYTTLDTKLGYKTSNWDIYAYVKNLTDTEYITYYNSNSMVSLASFGDSRIIGVGLKYKF